MEDAVGESPAPFRRSVLNIVKQSTSGAPEVEKTS